MAGEQYTGTNFYYTNGYAATTAGTTANSPLWEVISDAQWNSNQVSVGIKQEKGISPILYFKYVKSKFKFLENIKMNSRMKRLEKAFDKAVAAGQDALSKKILTDVSREARESVLYAKGIKMFIERDDLVKHKSKIRGGHISDTVLRDYTRIIPDDVLAKKEKVKDCFDDFVVYHYYNEAEEKKREEKQKMSSEEKSKMRDPILFGIIRETNRLYFVADWEDEYCDLTFEEMIDVLGKDEKEITIPRDPVL